MQVDVKLLIEAVRVQPMTKESTLLAIKALRGILADTHGHDQWIHSVLWWLDGAADELENPSRKGKPQ